MNLYVLQATPRARIPAIDPATVAMMVILSPDNPPPLEVGPPRVVVDVGVGWSAFRVLPGVAV